MLYSFRKICLSDNSTQYVLNIFSITIWASLHSEKCGWFRIFGIGLIWKHIDAGLRFSERYGYAKYLRIGKWIFEYLPH